LAAFEKAIELDAEDKWAYGQKGVTLREMKRYEEAVGAFDKAIELDEKYDWAYGQRGDTLREMARYEEALVSFEEALAIDPLYERCLESKWELLLWFKQYEAIVGGVNALETPSDYMIFIKALAIQATGSTAEALREFVTLAAALEAEDEAATPQKIIVYWMLGQKEKSKILIHKLLQNEASLEELLEFIEDAKVDPVESLVFVPEIAELFRYFEEATTSIDQ
jgi:tetratricopeptide (TPR) repeat protein